MSGTHNNHKTIDPTYYGNQADHFDHHIVKRGRGGKKWIVEYDYHGKKEWVRYDREHYHRDRRDDICTIL
jgi:hypothetical protein